MKSSQLITETPSKYNNLEAMTTYELLENINNEDQQVPKAVNAKLHQIEKLVDAIVPKMQAGGRVFYIGAGTSGRLGVLDASEIPPTYGVNDGYFIGLIAGGDTALRKAVENAEDDLNQAWKDLQAFKPNRLDTIIGIAASGTTPYVLGGLEAAKSNGIQTGGITCNAGSPLAVLADFPIEIVVGPEFVTGSTRMKSGTAQKLVLNMISTSVMIKMGRVKGNKMVDMQLTNQKLTQRGTHMIMDLLGIGYAEANALLLKHKSVRAVIEAEKESKQV